MPTLEAPGSFVMLVPDGWSATRDGGIYELTRPGEDGTAHVSVYGRRAGPLADDEVAAALGRFLASASAPPDVQIRVLKEGRNQHRAVAAFTSTFDGQAFGSLAFAVLWKDRVLMCSCNASLGSPMLSEAEEMFATIRRPKRGLLRRS